MPNKIYIAPEAAIVFKSSGGTVTFTPTSLGNNAGRVSARHDRGTGSRAARFEWRAKTKCATAPAVGTLLYVYLSTSDGASADGELGTADAALPALDRRRNLQLLDTVACDEASATRFFIKSGLIEVTSRYLSVVWVNEFGVSLSATAGDHEFSLTPVPDEVQ